MNTAERKIFSAHKKAGQYCQLGSTPTEALIKAAREDELNPEMMRRTSEMLNISLTKGFLQSAPDKTASFPLADCGAAMRQVFVEPTVTKTAAVTGVDWGSSEGSLTIVNSPRVPDHDFFKFAKITEKGNLDHLVCQAEGAKTLLRDAMSKRAQDKLRSRETCFDIYSSLISYFRKSDNLLKYAEFENQCYTDYGVDAVRLLDPIHAQLPASTSRGNAEIGKKARYFKPDEANQMFDSLVQELECSNKCAADIAAAQSEYTSFEQKIAGYYRASTGTKKEAGVGMLDFSKSASGLIPLIPSHDPLSAAISAHNTHAENTYGKGLESERDQLYKQPKDEADMEMDNVRRQSILADLMANDDIISGQHPQHVESAYNTLLSISPKSTLHREVVRSVLRNATAQQAIDPFTAKQFADLEGQHMKNKALVDGKALPAGTQS